MAEIHDLFSEFKNNEKILDLEDSLSKITDKEIEYKIETFLFALQRHVTAMVKDGYEEDSFDINANLEKVIRFFRISLPDYFEKNFADLIIDIFKEEKNGTVYRTIVAIPPCCMQDEPCTTYIEVQKKEQEKIYYLDLENETWELSEITDFPKTYENIDDVLLYDENLMTDFVHFFMQFNEMMDDIINSIHENTVLKISNEAQLYIDKIYEENDARSYFLDTLFDYAVRSDVITVEDIQKELKKAKLLITLYNQVSYCMDVKKDEWDEFILVPRDEWHEGFAIGCKKDTYRILQYISSECMKELSDGDDDSEIISLAGTTKNMEDVINFIHSTFKAKAGKRKAYTVPISEKSLISLFGNDIDELHENVMKTLRNNCYTEKEKKNIIKFKNFLDNIE